MVKKNYKSRILIIISIYHIWPIIFITKCILKKLYKYINNLVILLDPNLWYINYRVMTTTYNPTIGTVKTKNYVDYLINKIALKV